MPESRKDIPKFLSRNVQNRILTAKKRFLQPSLKTLLPLIDTISYLLAKLKIVQNLVSFLSRTHGFRVPSLLITFF